MSIERITKVLRADPGEIIAAWRIGSRVYGTARPDSDHDYLVIQRGEAVKTDLLFGDEVNIILRGLAPFQQSLREQTMVALEAYFAPPEHTLRPLRPGQVTCQIDRRLLREKASERSLSDYKKAARTHDDEPGPARKKLFHALRVPIFAAQLLRHGRLVDLTAAAPLWPQIEAFDGADWATLDATFGPLHRASLDELARITPDRTSGQERGGRREK
jgi:hypothetical protein